MIKNDKQYKITINKLAEFEKSLELAEKKKYDNQLMKKLVVDSLKGQIETFKSEIIEYENLKLAPLFIITSLPDFPEALVKARIAKGLTQSELANMVGLKEQQIQRYESTNYESASYQKLIIIANCMNIQFDETKIFLTASKIEVPGFSAEFIHEATKKLQIRKSLLCIN